VKGAKRAVKAAWEDVAKEDWEARAAAEARAGLMEVLDTEGMAGPAEDAREAGQGAWGDLGVEPLGVLALAGRAARLAVQVEGTDYSEAMVAEVR